MKEGPKARGRVTTTLEKRGPKGSESKILKNSAFSTHLLLGDNNAKVGTSMTYRKGTDYNSFVVSVSSWVELSCNQDDETVGRAQKLATTLAAKEIGRNEGRIDALIEEYEKEGNE